MKWLINLLIYLGFYNTCIALYTSEVRLDEYGKKIDKNDFESRINSNKKINAVLFLADTYAHEDYNNSSGLDFLKLDKKPDLKHCSDFPKSVLSQSKYKRWRFKRNTCTCYNKLRDGIMSLLNYAQNNLGMVTALGSLSNHSFSRSIRFGNTEIEVNDRIDYPHEDDSSDMNHQEIQNKNMLASDKQLPLTNEDEKQLKKIPLFNVFTKDSRPPFYAFTDEEERKKRSEGPYVMEPEHTEVFKIKTLRHASSPSKPNEINDFPNSGQESKVKSIFDIMDIVNTIQESLFNSMLPEDSASFIHDGDTCPIRHNILRNIRQPGLFEVVQKTLFSVINATDTGFLMIIIGGNLSDIAYSQSSLVQSIKHVSENTDPESTLIVLTGTCPNNPDAKVKLPCEELNSKTLPLFVTGPDSEEFRNCYDIYDIPITVKRILTKYNSKKREAPPQDLDIPLVSRKKRDLIDFLEDDDDDQDEEEEYDNEEQESSLRGTMPKRAARVTGGVTKGLFGSGTPPNCSNFPHIHLFSIIIFYTNIYFNKYK